MKRRTYIRIAIFVLIACCISSVYAQGGVPRNADCSLVYTGVVDEVVFLFETESRYNYFVVVDERGRKQVLFNANGRSAGFESYVGSTVRVEGCAGSGVIRWDGQKKNGIYVRKISVVRK